MKVYEVSFSARSQEMLVEANVYNVKDQYQGMSIASFLNNYHDNFSTPEAKKMWTKKLSKLLMNDERFLHALREVPQGAPEWAAKAVASGELMYFAPSATLKDNIDNLSHYIDALEQDVTGTNKDAAAVATRELQGFPRAKDLDELFKKANEFFQRGSQKASSSTEGMTNIYKTPDGYTWWKLDTAGAFQREGKVLQNCIGTHWTKSKTDKDGMSIVILRDPSDNSVVAARLHNKKNELKEMKGKNNKPPIQKYMPSVQALISKFKLGVSGPAASDITNTGYYHRDGKLYTKAQAIQALTKVKRVLTTLSNGMKLVEVDTDDVKAEVETRARDGAHITEVPVASVNLHSLYGVGPGRYGSGNVPNGIYDVRTKDGVPVLSFIVDEGNTLRSILRYPKGAAGQITTGTLTTESLVEAVNAAVENITKEVIEYLMSNDLMYSLSSTLNRVLQWSDNLNYNAEDRTFTNITPDKTITTGKKHLKWDVYTGDNLKVMVQSLIRKRGRWGRDPNEYVEEDKVLQRTTKMYTAEVRPVSGIRQQGTRKMLALAIDDNNNVTPFSIRGHEVQRYSTGYTSGGDVEAKTMNSVVALANQEKLKLPKTMSMRHGIGTEEDGKYSKDMLNVKVTKLKGDVPAKMWDFSEMSPENRLNGLVNTLTQKIRTNNRDYSSIGSRDEFGIMSDLENFAKGVVLRGPAKTRGESEWREGDRQWQGKDITAWFKNRFKGKVPNKVISVFVGFGHESKHAINMLARNNEIIAVDSGTKAHNWQAWDDFNKVAEQLNSAAKANGLKFAKSATTRAKEFTVNSKGEIQSQEAFKRDQLTKLRTTGRYGKEGVDEVPFQDGTTVARMTPEEQSKWQRQSAESGARGEAWLIKKKDGSTPAAFFVSNGKITQTFHTADDIPVPEWQREARGGRGVEGDTMPSKKGVSIGAIPYMSAVADKFDWKAAASMSISNDSRLGKRLSHIRSRGGQRRWSLNQSERELVALGLLDDDEGPSGLHRLSISHLGRRALIDIAHDRDYSLLDMADKAQISDDFVIPEKPVEPPRAARTPRAPGTRTPRTTMAGGGTKSQRALEKYNEITTQTGAPPSRQDFIALLMQEPFNMSTAGAGTYYYNTKKKAERANEDLGEGVRVGRSLFEILSGM